MSNGIYIDMLKSQFEVVNYDIQKKEDELRSIELSTFVLNPKIAEITKDIKELNEKRQAILAELKKAEDK